MRRCEAMCRKGEKQAAAAEAQPPVDDASAESPQGGLQIKRERAAGSVQAMYDTERNCRDADDDPGIPSGGCLSRTSPSNRAGAMPRKASSSAAPGINSWNAIVSGEGGSGSCKSPSTTPVKIRGLARLD